MVARSIRKVVAGGLLLFVLLAARDVYGVQDNAVGGTVWSQVDNKPLAGVTVVLMQNETVKDTTSDKDGVYVLRVPRSISTLHLTFKHPAYMPKTLRNLKNTEPQHKVKTVKLTPYDAASIRRLDEDVIQQLIADARDEISQTASGWDAALWETGTTTLRLLVNAAGAFDEQARQEDAAGNYAAAESLLKKALYIKANILSRGDPALSETVLGYAELLDKLGRKDEARSLRAQTNSEFSAWRDSSEYKLMTRAGHYPQDYAQGAFIPWTSLSDDKRVSLRDARVSVPMFLRRLDVEDFWLTAASSGVLKIEVSPDTSDFVIRAVDKTGKIVAMGEGGTASWRAEAGGVYHVYVINKTSLTSFRPVRISPPPAAAPASRQ